MVKIKLLRSDQIIWITESFHSALNIQSTRERNHMTTITISKCWEWSVRSNLRMTHTSSLRHRSSPGPLCVLKALDYSTAHETSTEWRWNVQSLPLFQIIVPSSPSQSLFTHRPIDRCRRHDHFNKIHIAITFFINNNNDPQYCRRHINIACRLSSIQNDTPTRIRIKSTRGHLRNLGGLLGLSLIDHQPNLLATQPPHGGSFILLQCKALWQCANFISRPLDPISLSIVCSWSSSAVFFSFCTIIGKRRQVCVADDSQRSSCVPS